MGHPFDVRCCKVNIFFSFAHHVSCFFSLFFSCHTPHCTVWHIFPTDNSCMASYCLPQSILLPPTINPTASHNQSYGLPQSILLPPGINPPASHNQFSCLPPSILVPPTITPPASNNQSSCLPQSILQPPGIFSLLYYMAFLHYVPLSVMPSPPSR